MLQTRFLYIGYLKTNIYTKIYIRVYFEHTYYITLTDISIRKFR